MSGQKIIEGLREAIYVAAEVEDRSCQENHCQRSDCNGFLCKNAIDAAVTASHEFTNKS